MAAGQQSTCKGAAAAFRDYVGFARGTVGKASRYLHHPGSLFLGGELDPNLHVCFHLGCPRASSPSIPERHRRVSHSSPVHSTPGGQVLDTPQGLWWNEEWDGGVNPILTTWFPGWMSAPAFNISEIQCWSSRGANCTEHPRKKTCVLLREKGCLGKTCASSDTWYP